MSSLLVDTDIFIDHLRGVKLLTSQGNDLSYSVITRCELFSGSNADERALQVLLAPFRELPVDGVVAERGGRIRRETGTLIADALIAATAIEYELLLFTRNVRHFLRVSGLSLYGSP